MMLQLAIYDGEQLLADWTSRALSCVASTGPHGDEALRTEVDLSWQESLAWYRAVPRALTLRLNAGPLPVWAGRLEDVVIRGAGGMEARALGPWRWLTDAPYTALWSTESYGEWRESTPDGVASRAPERYQMDNNNRIYLAPRKNENFDFSHIGGMTFETPDDSERAVVRVEFDYDFDAATTWRVELKGYNRDWSSGAVEWSLTSSATGSATVSFSTARDRIEFIILYNTGTSADYTGETGDVALRITNLRVMTIDQATVEADDVAGALLNYINGINPGRISTSTAQVQSPGVDLTELVIEDASPADVLDRLAGEGDGSSVRWEVGMDADGYLYLRPRGEAGRTWLVDVDIDSLERSLASLINSRYGIYQDAVGVTRRTAANDDAVSIALNGLTRRASVGVQSGSAARAAKEVAVALADSADPEPRLSVRVTRVLTRYQAPIDHALWQVRSGDTMVARNLPPELPPTVAEYLGEFIVERTEYDAVADTLTVEPGDPPPELVAAVLKEMQAGRNRLQLEEKFTTTKRRM